MTFYWCSRIAHGITLVIVILSIISIYYLSYDVDALKWDNAQIKGQILQIDKQDANSGTIQVLVTELIKKPNFGDLAVGKTISISYLKTPIQFQIGDCIEALGYWEGFLAVDPGGDHVDFIRKISCPSSPPPSKSCNPGPIGAPQCTGNAVRQLYQDSNCNQYWQTVDDCNRYIPSRCCQDGGCAKCGGQETYRCVNNVVQRLVINGGTEEWQVFDDCNSYNPPRQCIGGVCVKSDEPPTPPQKECDKQSCKSQNQPIGVPYNVSGIPSIKYRKCDCDPAKENCNCISVETQEIKFKGEVIKISDKVSGSKSYTINLDQLIAGPSWSGQLNVTTIDIFADYPKWGHEDAGIIEGNTVEVYGRCVVKTQDVRYVTLNGREEYYLRKLSGPGCEGSISGHVYDSVTNKPIANARILSGDGGRNGLSNTEGIYHLSQICPSTTMILNCLAESYESSSRTATVDGNGLAENIDFYLKAKVENPKYISADIRFNGIVRYIPNGDKSGMDGYWIEVEEPVTSGPNPCSSYIFVKTHDPIFEKDKSIKLGDIGSNIKQGDKVEVSGLYEEYSGYPFGKATGCMVSLYGSIDYYIKRVIPSIKCSTPSDWWSTDEGIENLAKCLAKKYNALNYVKCKNESYICILLHMSDSEMPILDSKITVPLFKVALFDLNTKKFLDRTQSNKNIVKNMYIDYYLEINKTDIARTYVGQNGEDGGESIIIRNYINDLNKNNYLSTLSPAAIGMSAMGEAMVVGMITENPALATQKLGNAWITIITSLVKASSVVNTKEIKNEDVGRLEGAIADSASKLLKIRTLLKASEIKEEGEFLEYYKRITGDEETWRLDSIANTKAATGVLISALTEYIFPTGSITKIAYYLEFIGAYSANSDKWLDLAIASSQKLEQAPSIENYNDVYFYIINAYNGIYMAYDLQIEALKENKNPSLTGWAAQGINDYLWKWMDNSHQTVDQKIEALESERDQINTYSKSAMIKQMTIYYYTGSAADSDFIIEE